MPRSWCKRSKPDGVWMQCEQRHAGSKQGKNSACATSPPGTGALTKSGFQAQGQPQVNGQIKAKTKSRCSEHKWPIRCLPLITIINGDLDPERRSLVN
eukprot:1158166-Pelagomonas_calceolata.AAC.7